MLTIPCFSVENMIDVFYRAPIDGIARSIDFKYFLFVRVCEFFSLVSHDQVYNISVYICLEQVIVLRKIY